MKFQIQFRKKMQKNFLIIFFIISTSFLFPKTFEQVYTYKAIIADSRLSARTIVFHYAMKLLLEEIASNLEVQIDTKKYFSKKVKAFTSDFIDSIKIIEEDWNGESYYLKVQTELEIFDLKNELYNLSKKTLEQLEEIQNKKEKCFQEIEKIREKFDHPKSEEEILELNEIYKETLFRNIYELIPYLKVNGEAEIRIEHNDSSRFYRKKAFIIAFGDALLELMRKIGIPVYESGIYNFISEEDIERNSKLYQNVNTKYFGKIKDFEISSHLVSETIEDNSNNSITEISDVFIQMEYRKQVYIIRLSENNSDELLFPLLFIDFPAIERIVNAKDESCKVGIGGLNIEKISFKTEHNNLKCSLSISLKN